MYWGPYQNPENILSNHCVLVKCQSGRWSMEDVMPWQRTTCREGKAETPYNTYLMALFYRRLSAIIPNIWGKSIVTRTQVNNHAVNGTSVIRRTC